MSFRLKTILGVALIEGVLLVILIWLGINLIHDTQKEELVKRASTIATLFATTTKEAVLSSDLASLESFTNEVMKNPDLVYARVLDQDGLVLAENEDPEALKLSFLADTTVDERDSGNLIFDAAAYIEEGGERYGQVQVGLNSMRIHVLLEEAQSRATGLAFLEMLLVASFSLVLGTWLTRQIKALEDGARKVQKGEFGHQIPVRGNDELAKTTMAFNAMSQRVNTLYGELQEANLELADAVQERTAELQLLYRVSKILGDLEAPLDAIFADIVATLRDWHPGQPGWCARITCGDTVESCKQFDESAQQLSTPIVADGCVRGKVEITYFSANSGGETQESLNGKQTLLDAVGQAISTAVAQRVAMEARDSMEVQLRHAQKLEAIGQLAAGIAHEINTPAQFVNDNTHFLQEAFEDYGRLLEKYTQLKQGVLDGEEKTDVMREVESLEKEIDLDYLREEIPLAVEQSLDGLQRISKIVSAMKTFAHPGTDGKTAIDLKSAIETTLDVSHNEWKYVADVTTEFDPSLPTVPVIPGEFNQVILNLIVNSAHAIEDSGREKGEIHIRTFKDGNQAVIQVNDNGCGIPESIKSRVFEPFFTTKDVGRGSGQGLSISYSVIVDKHAGKLDIESTEGKGSTFTIRLPLSLAEAA